MEHRLQKRYPITLEVRLVMFGQMVAIAHADDICSQGISVRNPGIELHSGDQIAVDFVKVGHPRPVSYCASAKVVHSNSKTIGLLFDSGLPTGAIIGAENIEMNESSMRQAS